MPGARASHCCGSSFGWLAILDTSITFFLLNPLTRQRIPVPALNNICDVSGEVTLEDDCGYVVRGRPNANFPCSFDFICRYLVNSFVLSSDPTNAGCVAMATFCDSGTFAFCKPGVDSAWTTLTSPFLSFQDIIFHKGRFYTVDGQLVLYVCDVGPQARVQEFPCTGEDDLPDYIQHPMERCLVQERRRRGEFIEKVYLVEHRGGLLMVVRTSDDFFALPYDRDGDPLILDFEVYQLDLSGEPPRWVELESLGDTALFSGPACSMALSAGDFPEGCRGNCIYVGDLWPKMHRGVIREGPDYGVFHYGDGHVERVPCCPAEAGSIWRPSVWISPSLRDTSSWG